MNQNYKKHSHFIDLLSFKFVIPAQAGIQLAKYTQITGSPPARG